MRMVTAVLIILVAFNFQAAVSARSFRRVLESQSTQWRKCIAKDEEFSILMPASVAAFATSITNSTGRLTPERVYSTYASGAVYLVVSYNASSLEGTFRNYKTSHLFHGEASFEREVQLGKHKGKQYKLKFGNVVGVLQVFSTKRHGYAVATIQAREDNASSTYFLSSLQLTDDGSAPTGDANATAIVPTMEASKLPEAVGQDPLTGRDVTRRAVVVSKPEPWYTDNARMANITGKVVLRVVLSAGGGVTNIHTVRGLSYGLTEQAIEAAKHIRFIPAEKDGMFVGCWMELQYNFDLY